MPFVGVDQPLENSPDDVVVQAREVEAIELLNQLPPGIDYAIVIERDARSDVPCHWPEDGLIVSGDMTRLIEEGCQSVDQLLADSHVGRNVERRQGREPLP